MQQQAPYRNAIAMKYPEQIVIALARAADGVCNPITLGWTMITSGDPPMMAVSIGLSRYSCEVFRAATEFVIAMPSATQADEVRYFGTHSGRDGDKLAALDTPVQPGAEVDGVLLAGAAANFECRKSGELVTGDHVIFVGQIVCSHVNPDRPDRLYTVGKGWQFAGVPRRD